MVKFLLNFLLVMIFCAGFTYAEKAFNRIQEDPQVELQKIEAELEFLRNELKSERLESLNAEMEAQSSMFSNWQEFVEDIEQSEEDEKAVLKIKERMKELNERKEQILKIGKKRTP